MYGAWWKSPEAIRFYLDGRYVYSIHPKVAWDVPAYIQMAIVTSQVATPLTICYSGKTVHRKTSVGGVYRFNGRLEPLAASTQDSRSAL